MSKATERKINNEIQRTKQELKKHAQKKFTHEKKVRKTHEKEGKRYPGMSSNNYHRVKLMRRARSHTNSKMGNTNPPPAVVSRDNFDYLVRCIRKIDKEYTTLLRFYLEFSEVGYERRLSKIERENNELREELKKTKEYYNEKITSILKQMDILKSTVYGRHG